jgi:hypothetical protein
MTEKWTAETIPPELAALHDAPGGASLRGLAEILNAYDRIRRGDMGRCTTCKTTIIRFDPPIEVKVDEAELCGAFKPGTYGAGMEVPVCLLEKGHDPDEMHWGVVEYETRWTDGGLEWIGKA